MIKADCKFYLYDSSNKPLVEILFHGVESLEALDNVTHTAVRVFAVYPPSLRLRRVWACESWSSYSTWIDRF